MKRISIKRILFIISIFSFLELPPAFSGPGPTIVVIRSKAIKPYNDALSGFEEELNRKGYKALPQQYDLESAKGKESQLIQEIKDLKPALIFVTGTEAVLFAKNNFKDFPVVFSMVLNPVKSGIAQSLTNPGNNLTGISLDISPELQFKKLKEILPSISRVGVIYNAQEKEWIKEVEAAAKKTNLTLVAKPINSEADVPRALDGLLGAVDCLWGQVDPLIYNAQSSQYILLTLLRNKMPFMAFSSQYVKAGALLALECDYNDIGRQAGQIAIEVLTGRNPSSIPIVFPQNFHLVVNKRIAEVIGIDIPKKILEEASEVYE